MPKSKMLLKLSMLAILVGCSAKDTAIGLATSQAIRPVGQINCIEEGMPENKKNLDGEIKSISLIEGFRTVFSVARNNENIFVVELDPNNRVIKLDKNGSFVGWMGKGADGRVTKGWEPNRASTKGEEFGAFYRSHHAIIDKAGDLYITEYGNSRVQKFSIDGEFKGLLGVNKNKKIIEGWSSVPTTLDGDENGLLLGAPTTYFSAKENFLYLSDFDGHAILKYTFNGNYLGYIGDRDIGLTNGWKKEGKPIKSSRPGGFHKPHAAITSLNEEYIYVVDTHNHRIQRFLQNGKFAGWIGCRTTGEITSGWEMEGEARVCNEPGGFNLPTSIDIDDNGNIYTIEVGTHRVQRFSPKGEFKGFIGKLENGEITKKWTKNGLTKEGSELGALNRPYDFKIYGSCLYAVDTMNGRIQIYEFSK